MVLVVSHHGTPTSSCDRRSTVFILFAFALAILIIIIPLRIVSEQALSFNGAEHGYTGIEHFSDAPLRNTSASPTSAAAVVERCRVHCTALNLSLINTPRDVRAESALGDGTNLEPLMLDGRAITFFSGGPADPLQRTCPRLPLHLNHKRPDEHKLLNAISKYTGYVHQYCNSSGMLQMHVPLHLYFHIIDRIAQLLNISVRQRVLDVGAGCGTLLNYLYVRYNTTGTGVDLTAAAVDHATRHAQPRQLFCHGDAIKFLHHLPSSYYHATISWSVLHHVRRKHQQCRVAGEMVRVTRPGGFILIGHLRGQMTQDFWIHKKRCQLPGTQQRVLYDYRAFDVEAFRRNKYPSVLIYKNKHSASPFTSESNDTTDSVA